jgi:pimeloyl-ACP methyl ester carboxylesterase
LDLASDTVAVVGGSYIPARDSAIQLPDGRALAYAEWGDPDGRPVLYFHGMPSSRLFIPDPDAVADEHVRLIAADRPGMGRSDPQPGHVVADWPADVVELANALDLERFGVIGWSAGTPYAFAGAALIPERLTGASATTSGAALRYLIAEDPGLRESLLDDDDRAILEALLQDRDAAERLAATLAAGFVESLTEHPEQLVERESDRGDEGFLDDPAARRSFVGSIRDAVRQGAEAIAPQYVAQVGPWSFRLEDITMPVHVWAGANDHTPPERMRLVADKIPNVVFTVWDDVGHAGIAKYFRDVLHEL